MDKSSGADSAHPALAVMLALAAGQVDGFALLHLHVFVANLTGTVVLLGLAAAKSSLGPVLPAAYAIAAFIAGTILAVPLRRPPAIPLALACAALLAANFARPGPPTEVALLGAAMGLQAGALKRFRGASVNTAFITGDMAQLGENLAHALTRRDPRARLAPALLNGLVVLAYCAGACLGAFALRHLKHSLLPPAALLLATAAFVTRPQPAGS